MSRNARLFIVPVLITLAGVILNCGGSGTSDPPSTGQVTIVMQPAGLTGAGWQLTGPYSADGTEEEIISVLPFGDYTVSWSAVQGYVTPAGETKTLNADEVDITFTGVWVEEGTTGTISIDRNPDTLAEAAWSLTGPQAQAGRGDTLLTGMPVGAYELTWSDVPGWVTPVNSPTTLTPTETLYFDGTYYEIAGPSVETIVIPPLSVSMPVTYTMGSDLSGQSTPHQATLTRRFDMTEMEITAAQYVEAIQWACELGYAAVETIHIGTENMAFLRTTLDGSNDPLVQYSNSFAREAQIYFVDGTFSTDHPDQPVEYVTWAGAAAYCDWLSLSAGLSRAYSHDTWICNGGDPYGAAGYRLPTEAEWEMACRAGTTTLFNTGDCLSSETEANYRGEYPFGDCPEGPALMTLVDVGAYPANAWGLFDMHGNIAEWCNDRWATDYDGDATDPVGPAAGSLRVMRGGYYLQGADQCRSAKRWFGSPLSSNISPGFRVVKTR